MKSYTNALKEIEKIVEELEKGEVPVDVLVTRVKRASELIRQCKAMLRETGQEVEDVLNEMNEGSPAE